MADSRHAVKAATNEADAVDEADDEADSAAVDAADEAVADGADAAEENEDADADAAEDLEKIAISAPPKPVPAPKSSPAPKSAPTPKPAPAPKPATTTKTTTAAVAPPSRRVSVVRKSKQGDPERVLRDALINFANTAILACEKVAEIRGAKPPEYLLSCKTYRDLLVRAPTLASFRQSIVATYTAHHSDIIKNVVDGEWLSAAKIPVKWVIIPKELANQRKYENFYLDVSKGFRNALFVGDYASENKNGVRVDPNLPELYLLKLYHVFREVCEDREDAEVIDDIIEALKPQGTPVSSVLGGIDQNSIKSIVGIAMDVMKQAGVEIDGFSPDDMASKISNVAQNPALGQLVDSVGKDLRDCHSPKDVVDALVKHVQPGTENEISQVMGQIKSGASAKKT